MDYRIEQLRYLLREDPSSRIFYQLGELLRREGEADQAVEVLRTGLERHPRYVAAWVSLGRSLVALDELGGAEEAFDEALSIDRENAVAARFLGETAMAREDWVRAIKALKLARALTGSDEKLDADIAVVEQHLAENGQLEGPRSYEPAVPRPQRFLEVVSVSSEDPFAGAPAEGEPGAPTSDVFEMPAEPPAADEPEEAAVEPPGPAAEAHAAEDLEASDEDRAEVADEVQEPTAVDEAPAVYEGSVGAWAAAPHGGGVPTEEAWAEPSDEIGLAARDDDHDDPWSEPPESHPGDGDDGFWEASDGADESPEEEPLDDGAEVDRAAEAVPGDELDEAAVAADALPGEDRGPELQELTRPMRIEEDVEPVGDEDGAPPAEEVAPPVDAAPERVDERASAAERERYEVDHGVPLPTMTLAKLALDQGDHPLAVATLENLIERDPEHAEARKMLAELTGRDQGAELEPARAEGRALKISALQGWLDAVRLAAERRGR